jgi:hypothetical protein
MSRTVTATWLSAGKVMNSPLFSTIRRLRAVGTWMSGINVIYAANVGQ